MPITTLTAPVDCPQGSCSTVEYDTPTLRWNHVDGAGWYRVYLATDPLFTNITKTYDTMFTSLTPSESLPDSQAGQATYWFVRPCLNASNCGPFDESVFGEARAFRKVTRPVEDLEATLPTPSGPGAPADNSVTFTWKDYLATNRLNQTTSIAPVAPAVDLEAASYQLQVSTTSNFTSIIDNVTAIDQTTYVSPTVTYADGPLYARVRAYDKTGNPQTWSDPISFTKSTPSPSGLLPTGGTSVTGTPLLQWTPMASAQQYDVEVYKNPTAPVSPTNLVTTVKTRLTTASLATALPAGQSYGWRVRRLDANAKASSWSNLSVFTVTGPAPVLTSPPNGSAVNSNALLFTWSAQARATRYKIDASTSSTFTSLIETATTDMSALGPRPHLPGVAERHDLLAGELARRQQRRERHLADLVVHPRRQHGGRVHRGQPGPRPRHPQGGRHDRRRPDADHRAHRRRQRHPDAAGCRPVVLNVTVTGRRPSSRT